MSSTEKVRAPTAREVVLRLAVQRMESGYKPGWLYYQCRERGILGELDALQTRSELQALEFGREHRSMPAALFIGLVPRSCWFDNVRSHVSADQWTLLKKRTFRDAGWRCEICRGVGPEWPVECHEVWNYDDATHTQRLERLVALCPDCHRVKHMGLANVRQQSVEATAHLALVNGWSYAKARQHVDEAFELWARRSRESWALDISYIEAFVPKRQLAEKSQAPPSLRVAAPSSTARTQVGLVAPNVPIAGSWLNRLNRRLREALRPR